MKNILYIATVLFIGFFTIFYSKKDKVIKTEYYSDFDHINVKGINRISKESIFFPYVEMKYYKDSGILIKFRRNKNSYRRKKYYLEEGILKSKFRLRQHDAGCNGFSYVEFYFAPNKMITYLFCEKENFDKKETVYAIISEEWVNNNYDYHSISTVANSFEKTNGPFLFTFDPNKDFNGPLFNTVGQFDESGRTRKEDSIIITQQTYYIQKDSIRKYISNLTYSKPFIEPTISIWRRFEEIY